MSFESGADYLRRLKEDQGEPSKVSPAPTSPPRSEESKTGTERRQSPRYKCEGSAEFRTDGSDVRTWGTFTDLSLHGCYIEMTATYPVGAVVNMGLELNGVRVDLKGEVRVSYPFLGIGVAFREVSEDCRQRLQEMVRSLLPAARLGVAGTPSPTNGSVISLPVIVNPAAALQALVDFFQARRNLTQVEFVQLIRKSQNTSR
jgi:hypothetical protein